MYSAQTFLLTLTTFALAPAANAQFSITWFTMDGGGGTSAGGQLSLSGTIAQTDAGTLSGGGFKLEGGFWSGIRVLQMPGAPILKITPIPGGLAMLSWPIGANGFQLQETTTIGAPNSWVATPQPVVDTATEHTVIVPAATACKCFRLKHTGP